MITPEDIKMWIEAGLSGSQVDVTGDGRHFDAVIVSSEFEGKSAVQRHQLVYSVLGEKMRADIHALSMRTVTPSESVPH
ncbi:MAG: BolA family transcriptional regulator [Gammaproteobacteria bacterium]|jgi:acid stress-induced BolA-like protein IbaG/YrbA|nr:MAG: BolA family transcriptional regulator [Gammaproteobacteria bacterium]|tara:strand:+ start:1010 stop:1246 length:237 start_codon:yes stop_codon:yes gene_type:complete